MSDNEAREKAITEVARELTGEYSKTDFDALSPAIQDGVRAYVEHTLLPLLAAAKAEPLTIDREALARDPDPGSHGGPIPSYGMLDVWMALFGTSHPEFDEFYVGHGYAETWARLLQGIRLRSAPFAHEAASEPEDERIRAWDRIASHWAFAVCYADERPLIDSMMDRLDGLADDAAKFNEARAQEAATEVGSRDAGLIQAEKVLRGIENHWPADSVAMAIHELRALRETVAESDEAATEVEWEYAVRCRLAGREFGRYSTSADAAHHLTTPGDTVVRRRKIAGLNDWQEVPADE